jgi:Family of unknown function (DUF5723)
VHYFRLLTQFRFVGLIVLLYLTTSSFVVSQHLLGISSSNYAGTNALYQNPAFVVDSRYKAYINLVTEDFSVSNNYINYKAPFSALKPLYGGVPNQYRDTITRKVIFKDEYTGLNNNGGKKHADMVNDLRGPSLQYAINDRNGIALTSRLRVITNIGHVTEPIAQLLRMGTNHLDQISPTATGQSLSLNANAFAEFGITYGRVLVRDNDWFIKGGISVKRVIGLYSMHFVATDASYHLANEPTAINGKQIVFDSFNANYGYTKGDAYNGFRLNPEWLIGNRPAGSGWGFDVGVVYEFRPEYWKYDYKRKNQLQYDPQYNKYLYRISVAIMDIGKINYNSENLVNQYSGTFKNVPIIDDIFLKKKNESEIIDALDETVKVKNGAAQHNFVVSLPTSLNVNIDASIRKNTYLNIMWVHSLTPTTGIAMQTPSILAITPRYETKRWHVAMPVSLISHYSTIAVGMTGRYGPLFIGTDHLFGLLNWFNPRGLNIYAGLSIPIFQRQPKSEYDCDDSEQQPRKKGFKKLKNELKNKYNVW